MGNRDTFRWLRILDAMTMYYRGRDALLKKVKKANEIYDKIIVDFTDYGCRNYLDTILKGMPEFFLHYDYEFNPQDHILTLDYPVMKDQVSLTGIDRIYDYLFQIYQEQKLMQHFPEEAIRNLLYQLQPEYKTLFYDNICYEVIKVIRENEKE